MAKKPNSLPLNSVLTAMDTKQRDFYANLTDEQKKNFSAWLMMRYASSVSGALGGYSLYVVNEVVNRDFGDLKHHPELLWLCLTAAATGSKQKHVFLSPGKKAKKNSTVDLIMELNPQFNAEEAQLYVSINSVQDLKNHAEQRGVSEQRIKKVFGKS